MMNDENIQKLLQTLSEELDATKHSKANTTPAESLGDAREIEQEQPTSSIVLALSSLSLKELQRLAELLDSQFDSNDKRILALKREILIKEIRIKQSIIRGKKIQNSELDKLIDSKAPQNPTDGPGGEGR